MAGNKMGTIKFGKIKRELPQQPDRVIDPKKVYPDFVERQPLNLIVKPFGILPSVEEEDLFRKNRKRYNF